jgi:hypothetical protein
VGYSGTPDVLFVSPGRSGASGVAAGTITEAIMKHMTVFRYIFVKLVGRFCFIFCCLFLVILLGFGMQQMHKIGGGGVAILRELLPYLASYVSV